MTTEPQNENQDETLGEGGVKALKAERDARKALERELRAANERVASLERADVLREVAAAKGIDPRLAARLTGTTREELEADADSFLELVAPEKPAGTLPLGRPTERLRGGGDPTVTADESAAALADRIVNS